MEKTFRLIEKKQEILSLIENAPIIEIGDVWQTLPEGRVIHPIQSVQIDSVNEVIILKTFTLINLKKDGPIFIRFNYRSLVFKLEPSEFKISRDKLTCKFPKTARAVELRKGERFKVPDKERLFVTIRPFHKGTTIANRVRVVDVSSYGVGIVIQEMAKDFFLLNKNLWIDGFNDQILDAALVAEVSHVSGKTPNLKKGEVRVGLRLSEPFSEKLMSFIKEEIGFATA